MAVSHFTNRSNLPNSHPCVHIVLTATSRNTTTIELWLHPSEMVTFSSLVLSANGVVSTTRWHCIFIGGRVVRLQVVHFFN